MPGEKFQFSVATGDDRMSVVRIGVIGVGNMGTAHCRLIDKIAGLELTAVCDVDSSRVQKLSDKYSVAGFTDVTRFLESRRFDSVLIATPHYDHTTLGIQTLKAGYHVMVEKPISVHKGDAEKLIRAHKNPGQVFGAMFNQRSNPAYQSIRAMASDGTLGAIRRIHWTITDWFRSQAYYDSGGWRATWSGEGGGVLLNQCPHQVDLLQWMFGMPVSLRAFCRLGQFHDIEVEDDVTAYVAYHNGATGVFTTTTGEAPGVNRLEVAADNGLLVFDTSDAVLRFWKNAKTVTRAIAENNGFEKPETELIETPFEHEGGQHREILENFAAAINGDAELIAPAAQGVHSVELANAMLLSAWLDKKVTLPISARQYSMQLRKRIESSTYTRTVKQAVVEDMGGSF